MKKLQGKVVFITGANSGIGKAAAIEAAKERCKGSDSRPCRLRSHTDHSELRDYGNVV